MTIECPKCHFKNHDNTIYCGKCFAELKLSEKAPIEYTEALQAPGKELTTG